MNWKLTQCEKCCVQNNQLPMGSPDQDSIELRDNFVDIKLLAYG